MYVHVLAFCDTQTTFLVIVLKILNPIMYLSTYNTVGASFGMKMLIESLTLKQSLSNLFQTLLSTAFFGYLRHSTYLKF